MKTYDQVTTLEEHISHVLKSTKPQAKDYLETLKRVFGRHKIESLINKQTKSPPIDNGIKQCDTQNP